MRVTDIKFDRNKQGIARSGCVGWTGARAKSLNDNYSCLSYCLRGVGLLKISDGYLGPVLYARTRATQKAA